MLGQGTSYREVGRDCMEMDRDCREMGKDCRGLWVGKGQGDCQVEEGEGNDGDVGGSRR